MTNNTDLQIKALEQANPLREPALKSAIAALRLSPGSRGLDIGCGIGLQTLLLAEAVRPAGHVTGLDISPDLLAYARQRVSASPLADRIMFKEGSMFNLPFEDNCFDWAWSADCVGYPAGDILPVLHEIARVVRPGGTVALLAWTTQQVLPGYSMLRVQVERQLLGVRALAEYCPTRSAFSACRELVFAGRDPESGLPLLHRRSTGAAAARDQNRHAGAFRDAVDQAVWRRGAG